MELVILMVSSDRGQGTVDLEVMPDVPCEELAEAIANALKWPGVYDIEVVTSGKRLSSTQSLSDANVWDGAHIRLVQSTRPPRKAAAASAQRPGTIQPPPDAARTAPGNSPAPAPSVTPVVGWRHPMKRDQER